MAGLHLAVDEGLSKDVGGALPARPGDDGRVVAEGNPDWSTPADRREAQGVELFRPLAERLVRNLAEQENELIVER